MDKKDVVLVVLNRDALEETVKNLNLDRANVAMIITDGCDGKTFNVGDKAVPVTTFATIQAYMWKYRRLLWLIGGGSADDIRKMRKFLTAYRHIPEGNTVNFDVAPQISATWLANVRHIVEHGANYFVTGNEYAQVGVNLNLIPSGGQGVILADANQTLRQSYLTAKHIFEHVAPGTIKFVLIGLEPDAFCRDDENFSPQDMQYNFAHNELLATLLNADSENVFATVTAEQADLNFDAVKATYNREFSAKAVIDWNDAPQKISAAAVESNAQILTDYIELCLANGAKPISVVLPFAPAVRKYFDAETLKTFRDTIHALEENHDFTCVDMFELDLDYDCYCDMTHLNAHGQTFVNALLAMKLYAKNLLPIESFCDMSYAYFNDLSNIAPKDEYNALMEKVFAASAQMIRRKDKIKIGFVLYEASQWSGDELYNLFIEDKRFETTIFFCKRVTNGNNDLFEKDFSDGVERFKSHGLKVVPIRGRRANVPNQDVIICLTPYFSRLPSVFKPANISLKTLVAHTPYSLSISIRVKGFYNRSIFHVAWKIFHSSVAGLKTYAKYNTVGMPRGVFSGYPRMDIFFKQNADFKFDWKMIRPDAKKIIWAPHWSINSVTRYATFQWNYKFMYEFAKAHPETSWVVKPHPGLYFTAVQEKVFPSLEAFEAYLQAWNDLPNAQVYTGGYYQAIFATSDGMIHDSGSFIAEYQYVDKPMIFLTRAGEIFNDLGNAILNVSYCVDGKDHKAIAATLKRVIIDGKDSKSAARKKNFNKHLNYPKYNGMLASEFIYHSIADELKEVPE